MTSDARATTLIRRHFLLEWPLVAIGVPCAVGGIAEPPGPGCFARLQVWCGHLDRRGWIHLGMWVPAWRKLDGSETLMDAARHVFDGQTLVSDDGVIVIDHGRQTEGSLDGDHWVFAAQFSFRIA